MTTSVSREAIGEHIEENRDRLVTFLEELVSARSLPGEEGPAQEVMKAKFRELDLSVDVWEPDADALRDHPGFFETTPYLEYGYEGRENVAAVDEASEAGGRSLVVSGHVDVVNPDPVDDWTYDPWDPTVENGRMYGRGTMDMKGGIAAFVHAYECLRELGVDLAGELTLQTTIEEEAGGVGGVLSALERGYRPDAAIVAEPSGVPRVGVASAGVQYFRVTVPGRTAHTAYKFLGVDAVGKAFEVYRALEAYHDELNDRIEDYGPALSQYPEAAGSTANLSLTDIAVPGSWTSTVPGEAVMEFRVGWPPSAGLDRHEVREEVEEVVASVAAGDEWLSEHPPEIEWFGWSTDPHEIDFESDFYRLVCEETEAVTGGSVEHRGGLGGNDERFYNRYYDIPTPSVGPEGGNGHGADEFVEIDSLVETAQIHALTMVDWCGVT
ncbi:ArgE/DapE family deacylase [Halorubrum rubrum]|uniref:ArgE/DapE family deacylase n=1 Tax=Halorubrum rubrum TaxID=1126240 RepID=A0ABD5R2M2_9EURY|nr:ArgE/DapE family deacylase [Halorubrum rubrum]